MGEGFNQNQLLLEMFGEIKEIKALLAGMQNRQDEHEKSMLELDGRVRRLERLMWMGIGAVAVIEPIALILLKRILS